MAVDLSIIQINCDLKTKYSNIQNNIDKLKDYVNNDDNFSDCTDIQEKMINIVNSAQENLIEMVNNKLSNLKEVKNLILNVQNCIALSGADKDSFLSGALDKASDILDGKFLDNVFDYINDMKRALIDESQDVCDYYDKNKDALDAAAQQLLNKVTEAANELQITLTVKADAQDFISKIAKAAAIVNCLNEATIKNPKLARLTSALEPELTSTITITASIPNKAEAMTKSIGNIKSATGIAKKLKSLI